MTYVASVIIAAVAALLVVLVLVWLAATERKLRRTVESVSASQGLLVIEIERRRDQLRSFIAAGENAGITGEPMRQLVVARSWSAAVQDRGLDLATRAAAENALSVTLHEVMQASNLTPDLRGNWALQQPAGELQMIERRIAGAVAVYNDNASRLNRSVRTFPTNVMCRALHVRAPEQFVEKLPLVRDVMPESLAA